MPLIRALVTIPKASAVPEDAVSNTWYFDGNATLGSGDLEEIHAALSQFYTTVDQWLSPILGTTATVKYYSMTDAPPRPVIYTNTIALTLGTANALPDEVAICMSYHGTFPAGQVRARRRGRIYLGPLTLGISGTSVNSNRPSATAVSNIATAADTLLTASAAEPWNWVVYSPTGDSDTPVVGGWVDDAFDTQRRRGVRPLSRTLFS